MDDKFGGLLRSSREASGKSMGQLARYLGVSVAFISDVERGARAPLMKEKIFKVAEFFGIDPEILLTAAAEYRGAIELDITANTSQKAREVGIALMRGWDQLSEPELDDIARILSKKGEE